MFSAQEHINLIYEKGFLSLTHGYWFGVTFDESLGEYIVDISGKTFDMVRYPIRVNASETKQVRIRLIILYDSYRSVQYRFSSQVCK